MSDEPDARDLSIERWNPVCVCYSGEEAPMPAIRRLVRQFPFETIEQVERTANRFNKVENAKYHLMSRRNLDEPEAYKVLRQAAMRHRTDVANIAQIYMEALQGHA